MSIPDPATTDWVPLATAGGGGIDYIGSWSAATPYKAGDIVRHNGVDYIAANPSTNIAPPVFPPAIEVGTALPASPVDKQEYILVDSLTAPTYSWKFRYLASIVDAYKWLCISGSPIKAENDASQAYATPALNNYVSILSAITIARAGIYLIDMVLVAESTSNEEMNIGPSISGAAVVDADTMFMSHYGSSQETSYRRMTRTLAAGATLTLQVKAIYHPGTVTVWRRGMFVTPVRVS